MSATVGSIAGGEAALTPADQDVLTRDRERKGAIRVAASHIGKRPIALARSLRGRL